MKAVLIPPAQDAVTNARKLSSREYPSRPQGGPPFAMMLVSVGEVMAPTTAKASAADEPASPDHLVSPSPSDRKRAEPTEAKDAIADSSEGAVLAAMRWTVVMSCDAFLPSAPSAAQRTDPGSPKTGVAQEGQHAIFSAAIIEAPNIETLKGRGASPMERPLLCQMNRAPLDNHDRLSPTAPSSPLTEVVEHLSGAGDHAPCPAAPETAIALRVSSFETHFPIVVANLVSGYQWPPDQMEEASVAAPPTDSGSPKTGVSQEGQHAIFSAAIIEAPNVDALKGRGASPMERPLLGQTIRAPIDNDDRLSPTTPSSPLTEVVERLGGADDNPPRPAAPETAIPLRVSSFATHFPIVVANLVSRDQWPPDQPEDASASIRPTPIAQSSRRNDASVKALTFELEPASFGTIQVRMKIMRSHIDLQIAAGSSAAASLLAKSRDKLSRAIAATGYEVDSLTIQVSSAPTSSASLAADGVDARRDSPGGSAPQFFGNDDGSAAHSGEGSQLRKSPRGASASKADDDARPAGHMRTGGLYL